MSDSKTPPPVPIGPRIVASGGFDLLYREGMSLIEDVAAYLDGAGRTESRNLAREASFVYATESMRLTTRLMQLASWLLLHRAVNEGEMSLSQARKEKAKVRVRPDEHGDAEMVGLVPLRLRELIDRSVSLQQRVLRLDTTIHMPADPAAASAANPVEHQMGLLRAAFDGGKA